jgi:EmrB/QacA subfamily drug resistance transporter
MSPSHEAPQQQVRVVTVEGADNAPEEARGNTRLAFILAMAMFVLVVDTSLMNVSISAVVGDLDTTVSGVQSAIALEALVSAAFILISSKIGDLIGRKRAFTLGLLGYATGALAMTLAQGLGTIVVFWAIVGGLGASLLLPAMQSLIRGNFEGAAQKRAYALVGAAAAVAAAVGPLLGGFVTTFLSWRVGFGLELVVIAVVLLNIKLVHDVPYTGPRQIDVRGSILSVIGMGGVVLGILVWQEGGELVGLTIAIGALALWALARLLVRRHREGKPTLLDPDLFRHPNFRIGISQQALQNITLGGAMIALPIFLQISLEYNALQTGLTLAPLSLTMFAAAILAGRNRRRRRSSSIIRLGFALSTIGMALIVPVVPKADSGWYLAIPLVIAGAGLGLLVSQLNNYTLAPIDEERISEAAGVNSAAGSFGLSFGLAMAGGVLLAVLSLSFTNLTEASTVIPANQQQQIADKLDEDAEVTSNAKLEPLLAEEPKAVQEEVISINTDATNRSLQVALLVPIIAGLIGLFNAFRMMRLPEIEPSASIEGAAVG